MWQVQEAKARLSEVIEPARGHGPQFVTRRGDERAAVPEGDFPERVIAVDSEAAWVWGELWAHRALPVVDTLIAATALVHDLTLATRKVRDDATTRVPLLNP